MNVHDTKEIAIAGQMQAIVPPIFVDAVSGSESEAGVVEMLNSERRCEGDTQFRADQGELLHQLKSGEPMSFNLDYALVLLGYPGGGLTSDQKQQTIQGLATNYTVRALGPTFSNHGICFGEMAREHKGK